MLSMTGFGRSTLTVNEGVVTVEIKTVNHRFLEIRSKISQEFSNAESDIEKLVRTKIKRGFCNINFSFDPADNISTLKVNTGHLNSYLNDLEIAAKGHNISVENLLPVISQAPDLLTGNIIKIEDFKEKALTACEGAIEELIKMRTSEGSAMAADIDKKLSLITAHIDKIETLAKVHEKSVFKQFKDKIESILDESGLQKDIERIETEAAILSEKADINEEITRLRSHINQINSIKLNNEPIGRKMDFIVQEISRETNTIGAKSALAEITHLVVDIKSDLEKIRELIQNVE